MQKAPKRPQLNIRARKNDCSALEGFRTIAQHFSSDYEALKYLVSLNNSPQSFECQKCEYCSEIPDEPDYIECHKPVGKQKTSKIKRKREYCYFGCPSSSNGRVEKNQEAKKARLETEISTLEDQKKEVESEIAKLTKELFDLPERIKHAEKIAKPKAEIKQKTEFSKIEPQVKAEPQENVELPAMKTSIEIERITERVMEKQKIVQEPVPDLFEGKEIRCPMTDKNVSITEQCERKCDQAVFCEFYPSIHERKIPEGVIIT